MIKIYRNIRYSFIALTGLLLWFFSFSLQSCSIIANRSNIVPITRQDLLGHAVMQVGQAGQGIGPLTYELDDKITELINEGFVEGQDPNNNDIRKHLMFVFHHSLNHKQSDMTLQQRLAFFEGNVNAQNLVWEFGIIDIIHPRTRVQRRVLEFRLRSLFNEIEDPLSEENLELARNGNAPDYVNENLDLDPVEVDHLLKYNDIVIELPQTLHRLKTRLIDNLINPPDGNIIRNASSHWKRRVRNL